MRARSISDRSKISFSCPAIALEYVDPAVRYPPGWQYDGKSDIRPVKVPFQETWKAMEALVDAGLVKAIGISNMSGSLLLDLLRYARIPPSVLQIGESIR